MPLKYLHSEANSSTLALGSAAGNAMGGFSLFRVRARPLFRRSVCILFAREKESLKLVGFLSSAGMRFVGRECKRETFFGGNTSVKDFFCYCDRST